MNNILLTIPVFPVIGISPIFAQVTKLSGVVTSAEDGGPIISASAKMQDTGSETITDIKQETKQIYVKAPDDNPTKPTPLSASPLYIYSPLLNNFSL